MVRQAVPSEIHGGPHWSRHPPAEDIHVMPIYKKVWKEDPRNYRSVSLTLVVAIIMEWFILSVLIRHV